MPRIQPARTVGFLPPLALSLALSVGGCGDAASGSPPSAPDPRETVVVLDRSGSVTDAEMLHSREVLTDLVNGLSYGDRLVVLVAHAAGRRDGAPPIVVEMPLARNPSRPLQKEESALEDAKLFGKQTIGRAFDAEAARSTDLIASMHTAVDQFIEIGSPNRSLVLMSDMLQCANGLCVEKPGSVPGRELIDEWAKSSRLPAFDGICVSAVGPDPSTAHGVQVREFWQSYFEAAGARFSAERYRHSVPDAKLLRCDGSPGE